ncbi:hypothetical protein QJS10_CPB04g01659 [Acorus calamus]|uniref:Tetratricopeptide repeat protein n=1 Tax=Acorus calamus TaxID=4465 RepID=A0AAV9EXU2_ACOCL|nr:hypothetical protein QJS10_CPB04g01659 [Acorus calamus]
MEKDEQVVMHAIEEDPDDVVPWNQLDLYKLCTLQFKASQTYLKAAEFPCNYPRIHQGLKKCTGPQQAHAVLSNLGNLYRQPKRFNAAKTMFEKSLELCPGYFPAYNNLGLVYVAEGHWEEAKSCFNKALHSDPLLDAAKSNMMKAVAMSRLCAAMEKPLLE